MKKGQKIKLESGREFVLPFTPVTPTGGKGSGKRWDGLDDDDWLNLFNALDDYTTKERNEVCKAIDGKSYQTLMKTFGPNPTLGARVMQPSVRQSSGDPLKRIAIVKSKIKQKEDEIEVLQEELATLADDGMATLQAQMAELQQMKKMAGHVETMVAMVPVEDVADEPKQKRLAKKG